MYLSLCALLLQRKPPLRRGGCEPRTSGVLSLFFSLVSLSRASTLAFLNLNSGMRACVQTPLPQLACMRGCPPIHTSGGGESAHPRIPKFRNQERKSTFSVSYFHIYIYIYNPLYMLQGALVRIAAYCQVLILVHKASVEATIRRRPPKRRRRLASEEASGMMLRPPMRRRLEHP